MSCYLVEVVLREDIVVLCLDRSQIEIRDVCFD